jgi:hypothetical protein
LDTFGVYDPISIFPGIEKGSSTKMIGHEALPEFWLFIYIVRSANAFSSTFPERCLNSKKMNESKFNPLGVKSWIKGAEKAKLNPFEFFG